jgi:membrane protein
MVGTKLERVRATVDERLDAVVSGRFIRALGQEIDADDVFGMAAEMAYRFLFAIFPLLLFLVAAIGFIGDAIGLDDLLDRVMLQAEPFLPDQVSAVIDQYVTGLLESRSGTFLTIGLLGTLWGAAGGVGTLIKGLNRAYDIERCRPFWKRQILAIGVTLTLPPAALLLFVLAITGRLLADWLGDWIGFRQELVDAITLARWPILVFLLFVALSLLYHILPNKWHRYVWSLPGAAIATAGWILLTRAFSLYVANFGNYDATYGSFGAAIAFLLWLYFVGVVVLLGAEINALLEPERRRQWNLSSSRRETKAPG